MRARAPRSLRIATLAWLATTSAVSAQEIASDAAREELPESTSRTYVNVRFGLASTNENGMPEVCMEGAPLAYLSFSLSVGVGF